MPYRKVCPSPCSALAILTGSNPGTEPDLTEFSRLFKKTLTRAVAEVPLKTPAQKEMQQGFIDDMARGGDWQYSLQFYFTWSKKRA